MRIEEIAIDTPTILELKQRAKERTKHRGKRKPYGFSLSDEELARLVSARVSANAILAYAIIRSAAKAAPRETWVTLRARVREAVNRDYRWWWEVTTQLEAAGFIQCQRHRGRLPRFHVVKWRKAGAS
jgi:hypothetical protein